MPPASANGCVGRDGDVRGRFFVPGPPRHLTRSLCRRRALPRGAAAGWPAVAALRGRTVFRVFGNPDFLELYEKARPGGRGAVLFIEEGVSECGGALFALGSPTASPRHSRVCAERPQCPLHAHPPPRFAPRSPPTHVMFRGQTVVAAASPHAPRRCSPTLRAVCRRVPLQAHVAQLDRLRQHGPWTGAPLQRHGAAARQRDGPGQPHGRADAPAGACLEPCTQEAGSVAAPSTFPRARTARLECTCTALVSAAQAQAACSSRNRKCARVPTQAEQYRLALQGIVGTNRYFVRATADQDTTAARNNFFGFTCVFARGMHVLIPLTCAVNHGLLPCPARCAQQRRAGGRRAAGAHRLPQRLEGALRRRQHHILG